MVRRILDSSVIYVLIAILFAIAAIFKTVSSDPLVVDLLWMCAIAFALLGLWRAKRRRAHAAAEADKQGKQADENM